MIIGLDIATECGVAMWSPNGSTGRPAFTTLRLKGDAEEVGKPMEKLRAYLADLHKVEAITHLFFEAAIMPRNGKTTAQTIYKLCSLAGMAEWCGYRMGAHVRQVQQQSWRKHFTGIGNGKSADLKEQAKKAARMRGWMISNDHEADAAGVLDYGLACCNIKTPWRDSPLFGGIAA